MKETTEQTRFNEMFKDATESLNQEQLLLAQELVNSSGKPAVEVEFLLANPEKHEALGLTKEERDKIVTKLAYVGFSNIMKTAIEIMNQKEDICLQKGGE